MNIDRTVLKSIAPRSMTINGVDVGLAVQGLVAEIDQLKAENEALRDGAFSAVQRLRADYETLRKDAERYRWLREGGEQHQPDKNCDGQWLKAGKLVVADCGYQTRLSELSPEDLDASIDAAMAKEASR